MATKGVQGWGGSDLEEGFLQVSSLAPAEGAN